MSRALVWVMILCVPMLLGCPAEKPGEEATTAEAPAEAPAETPAEAPAEAPAEEHSDSEPSDGAKDMCGAMGTIVFKPDDWVGTDPPAPPGPTTWWVDSDGIDPGTAGCHEGRTEDDQPNGRMFGEACLPDGLLVESNPGAGELHSHTNDIGHPDTFDCAQWCACQEGFTGGVCKPADAPPCEASAVCECTA